MPLILVATQLLMQQNFKLFIEFVMFIFFPSTDDNFVLSVSTVHCLMHC